MNGKGYRKKPNVLVHFWKLSIYSNFYRSPWEQKKKSRLCKWMEVFMSGQLGSDSQCHIKVWITWRYPWVSQCQHLQDQTQAQRPQHWHQKRNSKEAKAAVCVLCSTCTFRGFMMSGLMKNTAMIQHSNNKTRGKDRCARWWCLRGSPGWKVNEQFQTEINACSR